MKMKKILASILALCMLLGTMSTVVFASEPENITITSTTYYADQTIDLNGGTMVVKADIVANSGTLTIKNGTIDATQITSNLNVSLFRAIGKLVLENVTINANSNYKIKYLFAGYNDVTVKNSTINAANVEYVAYGESGNAVKVTLDNTKLYMTSGCSRIAGTGGGIAFTVQNESLIDAEGLNDHCFRNTTVYIDNSTVEIDGCEDFIKNDNGDDITVINGSTLSVTGFTSTSAIILSNNSEMSASASCDITIDDEKYKNYTLIEDTIITTPVVAKIGNAEYATLAAAITAANAGDIIEILPGEFNFDNTTSITIDKAITIKGAGKDATTLNFDSTTSAFVIASSGVAFSDMTITQGSKSNSFHISISKGAWDAPAVQYSDIIIENIDFEGGNYALCLIGEDVVVDSCKFTNQSSHNIIIYSVKGESKITNNIFNASTGSNKSAILYEGGADNATDLSNFIGGGTLTIDGNEAYSKGVFFQFTSWKLVEDMSVSITDNKIDAFTNKAIALYDLDGAITAAGDEFASFEINKNVFTNVPSGRPIIQEYTGKVEVDASENYLGSATPDVVALIKGEKVTVQTYYLDEALTKLMPTSLSGEGTEEAPYLISTAEELMFFRDSVNAGNTYEGKYVKVTATEIDLSGENWTSIGNGTRDDCGFGTGTTPFKGYFDGNGVTITGLTIDTASEKYAFVGLFGALEGGTIENITLENVNIDGGASSSTAALVGGMLGGTVSNITVSGTITANECAGVVGRIFANGTVKNCTNSADVTATGNSAAGIVGKAYYTREDQLMLIENCTNSGAIKSAYSAGGIVALSAGNVKNCTNNGTVEATGASGTGGIVGEQVNNGTVSGNTNNADIKGAYNAGGIAGWVRYTGTDDEYPVRTPVRVINNVNNGANITSTGNAAGGVVGEVYNRGIINSNKNYAQTISATGFAAGIAGALRHGFDGNAYKDDNDVDVYYNISTTPEANITANCTDQFGYDNETAGTELDVNYNYAEDFNFEFEITTKVNGVDSADSYKKGDIVTVTVKVDGEYEWIYGGLNYNKEYFKYTVFDFGGYISINERYDPTLQDSFRGDFLNEYTFEVIKVPEEDTDLVDNFLEGKFTANAAIVVNEQLANHSESFVLDEKTAVVNVHQPYSVTFDHDGDTTTQNDVTKVSVTDVDTFGDIKPSDPTLDKYEFDGWTLNGNLVADTDLVARGSEYVAQFSTSVTFVVDGTETVISNILKGTTFKKLLERNEIPVTDKTNYIFEGWTLDGVLVDDEAIVTPEGVYTALYSVDCKIKVICDYVTGYYLVQVYGDAAGYKFDGNSMYKVIHDDMTNYTFNNKVARCWIVREGENGFAPVVTDGYSEEALIGFVRERLTVVNAKSTVINVGYNINGINTGTDIVDLADAYSAYCVATPAGRSETTVDIMLASDVNGDGHVKNDDSTVIIQNFTNR